MTGAPACVPAACSRDAGTRWVGRVAREARREACIIFERKEMMSRLPVVGTAAVVPRMIAGNGQAVERMKLGRKPQRDAWGVRVEERNYLIDSDWRVEGAV